jgi:PAS domain S-box-containing protein
MARESEEWELGLAPDVLAMAWRIANVGVLEHHYGTGETAWSPVLHDILGTEPQAQPSLDIFLDLIHEDDCHIVADAIRSALSRTDDQLCIEHRIMRKDGELRWVCFQGEIVLSDANDDSGPRLVATLTDIAPWRSQQDRSGENEARLRAVLSIAPSAIISIDRHQKITVFNEAAEKLFGYDRKEVIGEPLDTLIPHRYRDVHRGNVESFWVGQETARKMGERQDVAGLRKDGSEFPAEASISKIEIGSERIFTVVLQDITERKNAIMQAAELNRILEQRVAERTQELEIEMKRKEDAQKQLIQSQRMEAFGQLTGGIAHDFNNLLAIVTGSLELMEPHIKDSPLREHIERAANAADMGARLTSRLLTFARHKVLEPITLNLNDQVSGLMELLHRTLGEQIILETSLSGDLWLTRVDPSEAENAILNLVLNARDAMPNGGRLLIETSNVTIDDAYAREMKGMNTGEFVRLSISDAGAGIAPELLSKVFEPFFTTKGAGHGSGLGLSTIYGFARQSGGTIAIYSELGKGTTVNLYLPRTDGEGQKQYQTVGGTREIAFSRENETILVVEDNPAVRETTLQRVEGLGYVVTEAEDGPAAMEIINREPDIALVLTDVVMPGGMSGYDLGSWIRENHPHIKVLLTSGFAPELMNKAVEGKFQFLRKPFNRAELSAALSRQLYGPD